MISLKIWYLDCKRLKFYWKHTRTTHPSYRSHSSWLAKNHPKAPSTLNSAAGKGSNRDRDVCAVASPLKAPTRSLYQKSSPSLRVPRIQNSLFILFSRAAFWAAATARSHDDANPGSRPRPPIAALLSLLFFCSLSVLRSYTSVSVCAIPSLSLFSLLKPRFHARNGANLDRACPESRISKNRH